MRERIVGLDCMKALLIALVVLGHAIQWTDAGFFEHWLWVRIYAFHMSAFFFVCGFFTYVAERGLFADALRVLSLLVPYAVWYLVSRQGGGLWFLLSLAEMTALFAIGARIANGIKAKPVVVCGLLSLALPLLHAVGVDVLPGMRVNQLPFFWGGYCLRHYWSPLRRWVENRAVWGVAFLIGGTGMAFYGSTGLSYAFLLRLVVALSLTLGMFGFFVRIRGGGIVRLLGDLGKETLGIYAVHYIVLSCLLRLPPLRNYWLLFVMTLILSFLFAFVASRIPFVNFLLCGKVQDVKRCCERFLKGET